ncbi:MAG: hypothetical protein ACRESJ_24560 [Pseudomonas sp.]
MSRDGGSVRLWGTLTAVGVVCLLVVLPVVLVEVVGVGEEVKGLP